MVTYSIHFDNGKEYLICGENIREAVKENIKYIEKLMEGCAIKRWTTEPTGEKQYKLTVEYYDRTPYQVKRLKNKPQTLFIDYVVNVVDED